MTTTKIIPDSSPICINVLFWGGCRFEQSIEYDTLHIDTCSLASYIAINTGRYSHRHRINDKGAVSCWLHFDLLEPLP